MSNENENLEQQPLLNENATNDNNLLARAKALDDLEKLRQERSSSGGLLFFPMIFCFAYMGNYMGYVNKSVLILLGCMCFSGLLVHMATHEYPERNGTKGSTIFERLLKAIIGKPSDDSNESIQDMITKFRVDSNNIKESHLLLLRLRQRLMDDVNLAEEAIKLDLIKYSMKFIINGRDILTNGKY